MTAKKNNQNNHKRDSQKKLAAILHDSNDAIIIQNLKGRILVWNKGAEEIYGYKEEEALGMNISKIIPKSKVKEAADFARKLSQGKFVKSFETERIAQDGSVIEIVLTASVIETGKEKLISIITIERDITEKKRKIEELRLSEEKYKTLFDSSPNVIILLSKEGKILAGNKMVKEWLGYDQEDFVGQKLLSLDFLPAESKKKVKEKIEERFARKKVEEYELEFIDKLGEKRTGMVRGTLVGYQKNENIFDLVVVSDVTEKRKDEEIIRREKEKAERYLKLAGVIIIALDRDGRITMINRKGNEILGYENGDLVGKNWFNCCLPNKNVKEVKRVFSQLMKGEVELVKHYENPVKNRKGEERMISWFNSLLKDEDGKVVGVISSGEDVTEKKKAELEARELAAISEYNTQLINKSDLNGKMTFINKAGAKMLGIAPRDVSKHNILDVIPEKWMKTVKTELLPAIKSGKVWEGELAYKNLKTGKITEVHAVTFAVKDDAGKPLFLANVSLDITKEKELDKQKSEFISIASHQLKTPLTGIKWTAELLGSGEFGELNGKQREFLGQIQRNNDRLIDLTTDLLDVSHIESEDKFNLQLEAVHIAKDVEKILKDEEALIEERKAKVSLENSLDKNLEIVADENKIRQALHNIINNAIRYSQIGSEIRIGVSARNKKEVVLFISDNGIGIPADQQKRVFEKFFRGSNVMTEIEGTGLGLYISKAIVEAHGGKIWFESGKEGTTFFVSLPIKSDKHQTLIINKKL